jgi:hypothetical protein
MSTRKAPSIPTIKYTEVFLAKYREIQYSGRQSGLKQRAHSVLSRRIVSDIETVLQNPDPSAYKSYIIDGVNYMNCGARYAMIFRVNSTTLSLLEIINRSLLNRVLDTHAKSRRKESDRRKS